MQASGPHFPGFFSFLQPSLFRFSSAAGLAPLHDVFSFKGKPRAFFLSDLPCFGGRPLFRPTFGMHEAPMIDRRNKRSRFFHILTAVRHSWGSWRNLLF